MAAAKTEFLGQSVVALSSKRGIVARQQQQQPGVVALFKNSKKVAKKAPPPVKKAASVAKKAAPVPVKKVASVAKKAAKKVNVASNEELAKWYGEFFRQLGIWGYETLSLGIGVRGFVVILWELKLVGFWIWIWNWNFDYYYSVWAGECACGGFGVVRDVDAFLYAVVGNAGPDRRIYLPEGLLSKDEIPAYLTGEIPGE